MQMEKTEIKKLIDNAENIYIEEQKYRIGRERESYYNTNDTLYDRLQDDPDCIEMEKYEFPTKDIENFQKGIDEGINPNITVGRIQDLLCLYSNTYDEDWKLTVEDLETEFEDLEEKTQKLIIKTLEEITREDLEDANFYMINDGAELFNVDEDWIYEWDNEEGFDSLAYWTLFFKPHYDNLDIALKCRLVPFYYDDELYLALGGSGMDLSPKLDAYIVLCGDILPSDSILTKDINNDYFKYVVGDEVFKEVMEKITLDKPHYIVSFDGV
jgi:hypothetical protein